MRTLKISFLVFIFSITVSAQNWFPLKVGNRWDYGITTYSHGGNWYYDSVSIRIVDEINFGASKNYFVFSPYGIFDKKYLRYENDSLYAFIEEDSTECLLLAFNQDDSSRYFASCHYDSVYILFGDENYFGYPDSQQFHATGYQYVLYEISQKFGFVFSDEALGGLYEKWYYLKGCTISDTTYGVLLSISEEPNESPNSFLLAQNYPNPFNPVTKIKLKIPGQARNDNTLITLKVYDVLGKEVATLVNEEKPAGEYEVEFNAVSHSGNVRNLPSGIYFYQLKAGEFSETKKMILMK